MVNKKDLRGGVAKMREVAELLTGWADDMERSLEKKPGKKTVAALVAEPEESTPAAEPVAASSFEDVRGLLAAKSAAGYRAQVLALINSFGAEKLSEVDPSHFGELMESAALLGLDGDIHAG